MARRPLFLARLSRVRRCLPFPGVLDGRVLQTASALYAANAAQFVLPLLTIPYLARVLGPEAWGMVVFVQTIGLYIQMMVEYSFDLSATRRVAKSRHNISELSEIVAGVVGARALLALGCVGVLGLAQLLVPTLRDLGWVLWLGALWMLAAGFRPFWFFLGLERVSLVLIVELVAKVAAVAGIFFFVRQPADGWKVFGLQGLATVIATAFAMVLIYRMVEVRAPSLDQAVHTLKDGWNLLVFKVSTSIYGMSNSIILGFLAPTALVGYYAGAERVIRAMTAMMLPALQAMFPRASSLAHEDRESAARLARISTLTTFGMATLAAAVLFFAAPAIIRFFLGSEYSEAVPVLRVLLLLLPILGISIPLVTHWMIPVGLDGLTTKVTLTGGMLHLPLAVFLGWQFAHVGIAWALVITETFILGMFAVLLLTRGLGPFRMRVPVGGRKTVALGGRE